VPRPCAIAASAPLTTTLKAATFCRCSGIVGREPADIVELRLNVPGRALIFIPVRCAEVST